MYFNKYHVSTIKALGVEGNAGVTYSIILLAVMQLIKCKPANINDDGS